MIELMREKTQPKENLALQSGGAIPTKLCPIGVLEPGYGGRKMIIRQVCKGCSMYWVGAAPTDMKLYVRWV